jgi:hypothetical protein
VEGGARRGVYSGGAPVTLDQIGLNSVFDLVYAAKALWIEIGFEMLC